MSLLHLLPRVCWQQLLPEQGGCVVSSKIRTGLCSPGSSVVTSRDSHPSLSSEQGLLFLTIAVQEFVFSEQSNFTLAMMATCQGGTAKSGAALCSPPMPGGGGCCCISLPLPPQQIQVTSPKKLNPGVDPGRNTWLTQLGAASAQPTVHPGAGAWSEPGFPSSGQEVPLVGISALHRAQSGTWTSGQSDQ